MAKSWYMKPWKDLYAQLHSGETPTWSNPTEAKEWIRAERDRVEPYILEILKGQHPDKPWSSVLFVTEAIPTPRIREVLIDRAHEIINGVPESRLVRGSSDANILAYMLDILTNAHDPRVRDIALDMITVENQAPKIVEHAITALRRFGGGESLESLRRIGQRAVDLRLDRDCALAEKIIEARVEGKDLFADAVDQLRNLNVRFVHAIEEGDYEGFASIQPFGFRAGVDAEEFGRKYKASDPDITDIVRAMKGIAGKEQFDIDRGEYQATLVVEGKYKFTYVLEVDGWKIFGPIRVGP